MAKSTKSKTGVRLNLDTAQEKAIAKLVGKYTATRTARILAAPHNADKLVKLRTDAKLPVLKVSVPTLVRIAKKHGVVRGRGRPKIEVAVVLDKATKKAA